MIVLFLLHSTVLHYIYIQIIILLMIQIFFNVFVHLDEILVDVLT